MWRADKALRRALPGARNAPFDAIAVRNRHLQPDFSIDCHETPARFARWAGRQAPPANIALVSAAHRGRAYLPSPQCAQVAHPSPTFATVPSQSAAGAGRRPCRWKRDRASPRPPPWPLSNVCIRTSRSPDLLFIASCGSVTLLQPIDVRSPCLSRPLPN
jgi:hypothetical protein